MDVVTFSVLSGLACLVLFGVGNALVKIPCKEYSAQHFLVYKSIITSSVLFILLLFTYKDQTFNVPMILFSIALGALGFVAMSLFYKAMEIGKVGIISPVAASAIVFTLLFTSLFLHLQVSFMQITSILLITMGIVLINLDLRQIRNTLRIKDAPGLNYVLIHIVLMGMFLALTQIPNNVLGPVLYPFIGEFSIGLYSYLYLRTRGEILVMPDKNNLRLIIIIGLILSFGIIFLFNGLRYGNPMIIFPIYYASTPIVALIGYFLYKERLRMHQYIATAIIIIGVVVLKLVS